MGYWKDGKFVDGSGALGGIFEREKFAHALAGEIQRVKEGKTTAAHALRRMIVNHPDARRNQRRSETTHPMAELIELYVYEKMNDPTPIPAERVYGDQADYFDPKVWSVDD